MLADLFAESVKKSDETLCRSLLGGIGCSEGSIYLGIAGEPRSKARPRFTSNGGVYSDKKQREHEKFLKWHFRAAIKNPLKENVAIVCVFYRSTKQRIDLDNLLKQVFDAANEICWLDDMQVTACVALLRHDRENPRTLVAFGSCGDAAALDRTLQDIQAVCEECQQPFVWRRYPSTPSDRRFCSMACKNRSGKTDCRAPANCRVCEKEFTRKNGGQSICSEECRIKSQVDRNKTRARGPSRCQNCGARVSRFEYRRCRKCFSAQTKSAQSQPS